ncbi:MAG: CDP-alcohol phosphatidyltransferase family protein, partial [Gammaproteobacteria bacterium]|nr:CDP-alcohol phosphatidyltransferase family protein [Gammaproteobacteria bacterium]
SELGAFLDPVADKLLMASSFIWLAMVGLIPVWLAIVLVGRDLVIVGGAISYRVLIGPFQGKASYVSKLNTVLQVLFVATVLANAAFSIPAGLAVSILGSLVFVTAVISGMHYVRVWTLLALHAGERA